MQFGNDQCHFSVIYFLQLCLWIFYITFLCTLLMSMLNYSLMYVYVFYKALPVRRLISTFPTKYSLWFSCFTFSGVELIQASVTILKIKSNQQICNQTETIYNIELPCLTTREIFYQPWNLKCHKLKLYLCFCNIPRDIITHSCSNKSVIGWGTRVTTMTDLKS